MFNRHDGEDVAMAVANYAFIYGIVRYIVAPVVLFVFVYVKFIVGPPHKYAIPKSPPKVVQEIKAESPTQYPRGYSAVKH